MAFNTGKFLLAMDTKVDKDPVKLRKVANMYAGSEGEAKIPDLMRLMKYAEHVIENKSMIQYCYWAGRRELVHW